MSDPGYRPYEPQLTPQRIADRIWTVDGPEVAYRFAGLTLPCPTRMTIVQLADGQLWLHSPTAYTGALGEQVAALGTVAWIVAPNSFHYCHIAAWAAAFPEAACHVSPDLAPKLTVTLPAHSLLDDTAPMAWASEIDQLLVRAGSFTEAVFFHRHARTLIVTDLMQNFEASRIGRRFNRLVLQIGGATGPRGTTSMDVRHAARKHHAVIRAAAVQMAAWNPARIILSHGKCYDHNVQEELATAFAWARSR
ncbi:MULTISPECIES: DUF4336 domain-containing protein [unclassified Sphingomonas]|uniref:DUF4336 domain-containing protein n=1 Tax=unclassified Sphingomonas TaxID=196159 RepID=UPI000BC58351|nr:MAG: hypothetical protein B7Y98_02670 [Sphingomonas sp. 32-62-10]